MKKKLIGLAVLANLVLLFVIFYNVYCMGNVYNAERVIGPPAENHTEEDINLAMDALEDFFRNNLYGCVLYDVTYLNMDNKDNESDLIVLRTTFECKRFGKYIGISDGEIIGHAAYSWDFKKVNGEWIEAGHGSP